MKTIIQEHKNAGDKGIYSVCSANRHVLEASMKQARMDESLLLVEATSNQVDQFGGYTGMKPLDFKNYVISIADEYDFPTTSIILGGDHLGPNVWQQQPPGVAMENALTQIEAYIQAGFTKVHLDASMPLGDERIKAGAPLDPLLVARRSAELCEVAERASSKYQAPKNKPVYVIGTDVPIPGGAKESLKKVRITPVNEVEEILRYTEEAFKEKGLEEAWRRVIAVVVQPGVEFGDQEILAYDPEKARSLSGFIADHPEIVYEAHSTDYQAPAALLNMVRDHYAILKVGPWLTYAFREAIFSLAIIENELSGLKKSFIPSNIIKILEQVMTDDPGYWERHHHGTEGERAFARKYSFSDRIRYYWPQKSVWLALDTLLNNLHHTPIPISLLSQYLPYQYQAVRSGQIKDQPLEIIHHKIMQVLSVYSEAANMKGNNIYKTNINEN
jgi:D-tagatose-1,6-bisphosphate aldolase subunit GatZ/KbaZ